MNLGFQSLSLANFYPNNTAGGCFIIKEQRLLV